jgi:antitoxin VapB
MTDLAKVFRSGNSQAVRLPKAFRFDVDEVEVTREGDAVILRPHIKDREPWANVREAIRRGGFSEDFLANGRDQPELPEDRDFSSIFP